MKSPRWFETYLVLRVESSQVLRKVPDESDRRLFFDQAGRSLLAALQSDENPERGLSGAHRERESWRAALAFAAEEREHAP